MRLLVLAILVCLAGCAESSGDDPADSGPTSSSSTTSATQTGSTPTTHEVRIVGFAFMPGHVEIRVGDTVRWTNEDGATHTVDSTDGGPLDSGNMAQGATYSYTFTEAGAFAYRCDLHPSMTAAIHVA